MKKLLWLDDDPVSISFDKDVLVPDTFDASLYKVVYFEKIRELSEYLYQHSDEVTKEDIFVIDIMLYDEPEIILPDGTKVEVPDVLMAGTIFYTEYLKVWYPDNPVVLYTSREHQNEIFQNITSDPRFGESLFLVDKWKNDSDFIEVLGRLLKEERHDT